MAQPVDLGTFSAYRNDAWEGFVLLPELDANSNVVELSTYGTTWTASIRPSPDAQPAVSLVVDQTNYDGHIDSTPTGPRIKFTLTGATVGTLVPDQPYVGDVQVTGGPLDPLTYGVFKVRVTRDVTHA